MSQQSNFITFNPGAMAADGDLQFIVRASNEYGGITIKRAYAVNGAATDAGTSMFLVLQNYGTSGTVAGGTVGTAGGTVSPLAADTPKEFTLTAANVFIDNDEWLVLKKAEQGATSDFNAQATIMIEYVEGVVLVG